MIEFMNSSVVFPCFPCPITQELHTAKRSLFAALGGGGVCVLWDSGPVNVGVPVWDEMRKKGILAGEAHVALPATGAKVLSLRVFQGHRVGSR